MCLVSESARIFVERCVERMCCKSSIVVCMPLVFNVRTVIGGWVYVCGVGGSGGGGVFLLVVSIGRPDGGCEFRRASLGSMVGSRVRGEIGDEGKSVVGGVGVGFQALHLRCVLLVICSVLGRGGFRVLGVRVGISFLGAVLLGG
jgi:hypothetical protein